MEKSGLQWIVIIAIGVLTGNAMSFGASELYNKWQLERLIITTSNIMAKNSEASLKLQKELKREQRQNRQINNQLQNTCNFWKQQVINENTKTNKRYRDMACAKVNQILR